MSKDEKTKAAVDALKRHLSTKADRQAMAQAALREFDGPTGIMSRVRIGCDAAQPGSVAHATYLKAVTELVLKADADSPGGATGADLTDDALADMIRLFIPVVSEGREDGEQHSGPGNPETNGPGTTDVVPTDKGE